MQITHRKAHNLMHAPEMEFVRSKRKRKGRVEVKGLLGGRVKMICRILRCMESRSLDCRGAERGAREPRRVRRGVKEHQK